MSNLYNMSQLIRIMVLISLMGCDAIDENNEQNSSYYKSVVESLFISGNWESAIHIANIELTKTNLNNQDRSFYLVALGQNYRLNENYSASEEAFRDAVLLSSQHNDQTSLGEAYYGLGDIFYLKWNYFQQPETLETSIAYLDSAMATAKQSGNLVLVSKCLYRSGTIAQIQGKGDESIRNFEEGIKLSLSIADTAGIIRNDTHMANDLEILGVLDSALCYYSRAYKLARAQNNNYSEAHALSNLGEYYFNIDQWDSAVTYFNHAQILSKELNHGIVMCRSYLNLGRVNVKLGKKLQAKKYFEMGLAMARQRGYKNYENGFIKSIKSM